MCLFKHCVLCFGNTVRKKNCLRRRTHFNNSLFCWETLTWTAALVYLTIATHPLTSPLPLTAAENIHIQYQHHLAAGFQINVSAPDGALAPGAPGTPHRTSLVVALLCLGPLTPAQRTRLPSWGWSLVRYRVRISTVKGKGKCCLRCLALFVVYFPLR